MRILTTIAVLALMAAPLEAQTGRNARRGAWFGFGAGAGSVGPECDTCILGGRAPGAAGYLQLGGTVSRSLLVGAEISGWAIRAFAVDQSMVVGMITVHWYPARDGAFFLKAGVGGLGYRWNNGTIDSRDIGPGAGLGAGYDIRIGQNVSFVPFLNAYGASDLKREVNGAAASVPFRISRDIVQIGVGITFH